MRPTLLFGVLGVLWATSALAWPRVDAQLNTAARAGDVAAIDKALAAGANPDQARALAAAVAGRHRQAVDDLLAHHADPNAWARGQGEALSGPEESPVFEAAKLGDRALLLELVRHGADLSAESRVGYVGDTPLAFAARYGEVGAVRLLIEAGADVNHRSGSGATALRDAISGGPHSVEIVQWLLAHGANPDIKDNQGKTAREFSSWYGPPGIRAAIERAKPAPPFSGPEDRESIRGVLLCRAADGSMIPGYLASTSAAYERWRAPRAAVIAQIESAAEYRSSLARLQREVTPAATSQGRAPGEGGNAGAIQSQCNLVLPPELVPAQLSQAAQAEHLRMVLICKATYDTLIPGYEARTRKAYARWRASHRAALARFESSPQFQAQRAEAIREVTPVGSGSFQTAANATAAKTVCESYMPADLLAAAGPSRNPGSVAPPVSAAEPPRSLGSSSGPTASPSAAASEPAPEGATPAADDAAAASHPLIEHPNPRVKLQQVVQPAPSPIGGAVAPSRPQ